MSACVRRTAGGRVGTQRRAARRPAERSDRQRKGNERAGTEGDIFWAVHKRGFRDYTTSEMAPWRRRKSHALDIERPQKRVRGGYCCSTRRIAAGVPVQRPVAQES